MASSSASDPIRTVTRASFQTEVLDASGPIAVEFMSYGCAHCRLIEPVLEQVAEMVKSTESVVRINVAVEDDLAETYDIQSTPTFVMFRDGAEVGRVVGPKPNVRCVLDALTQSFES